LHAVLLLEQFGPVQVLFELHELLLRQLLFLPEQFPVSQLLLDVLLLSILELQFGPEQLDDLLMI
jgi:hypothetical protein